MSGAQQMTEPLTSMMLDSHHPSPTVPLFLFKWTLSHPSYDDAIFKVSAIETDKQSAIKIIMMKLENLKCSEDESYINTITELNKDPSAIFDMDHRVRNWNVLLRPTEENTIRLNFYMQLCNREPIVKSINDLVMITSIWNMP